MAPDFLPFTRPSIDEATIAGVAEVLRGGWITSGPRVLEFERALSAYLGGREVRTLNHATGAMEVALELCGIGPGDEVIVPAMSFVCTANVVMRVGARPVFVDVDLDTRNLDLAQAEDAINERTRAIIPVHFAGLPADMDALYALAHTRRLRVIEDAAQALGSRWKGRPIGSFGDIASFSFHANKNLTTAEGGALAFPPGEDLPRFERLRFHGILKNAAGAVVDVDEPGGKYNLTDVAARIGLGQLPHLEAFNARRRALAQRYFERLPAHPALRLPSRGHPGDEDGHNWHMFCPLVDFSALGFTREQFVLAMRERGIGVGVHYPAIHLFSLYRQLGHHEGEFPHAERVGRETVTLPLFPAMRDADVDRVCEAIAALIGAGA